MFLDKFCCGDGRNSSKSYIINVFKNYKTVLSELDKMENCEQYQYINSLNIFSLTLGPFEHEVKEKQLKDNTQINASQIEIGAEGASYDQDPSSKDDQEFINLVNESKVLKIEIWKLMPKGDVEPVWKLQEWLEYNKVRTS